MKKITSLLVAFFMLTTPLMAPVFVHAIATDPDATTASSDPGTAPEETKTETEAEKTARATRLEAYKLKLAERLTAAAKTRLAGRCVAAQTLVKAHTTRSAAAIKVRTGLYDNIVERLEKVVTNVKGSDVDTVALEANITVLKEKITAFEAAADTYAQALADLAAIDCKADPEAFKAALESARTDQQAAMTAAKEIRAYLADIVKPTLKALKEAVGSNAEIKE